MLTEWVCRKFGIAAALVLTMLLAGCVAYPAPYYPGPGYAVVGPPVVGYWGGGYGYGRYHYWR